MASHAAKIAFSVVLVVLVLAILGVSIAALVTVINIHNESHAKDTASAETTTAPPTTAAPDTSGGVDAAPLIATTDSRYAAYKQIDDTLKSWMDTTVKPCDDFYNYVCKTGMAKNMSGPFGISTNINNNLMLASYKDAKFFEGKPQPMQQLKHYFDKCVTPDATAAQAQAVIKRNIEKIKTDAAVNFPMLYQDETVDALPPLQLSRLLGFAYNDVGDLSLLPIGIDSDLKQPDDIPAQLYLSPPSPLYASDVYEDWENTKANVTAAIQSICKIAASAVGLGDLNEAKLLVDATAVADMDYALYHDYQPSVVRLVYQDVYNKFKLSDLQTSAAAFDWVELIKALLTRANAVDKINGDLDIIVLFPDQLTSLSADIAGNTKFTASQIANYIQYHAITSTIGQLPALADLPSSDIFNLPESLKKALRSRQRKQGRTPIPVRRMPTPEDEDRAFERLAQSAAYTNKEYRCFREVSANMLEAGDRAFLDAAYPTEQSRTDIRKQVNELAAWIFSGFRTQIDMLNWMDDASKKGAYGKLDNIQLSVAFPDWIADDAQLTAFYAGLTFTTTSNSIDLYDSLNDFLLTKSVENFRIGAPRDRGDFLNTIGITNAFYNPQANAMIMPGGILNQPFYDPGYPAAFKFGSLMWIVGHELTHGFDDQGVQFNGIGALENWMDDDSAAAFRTMADCVVDEYSNFCPLPDSYPAPCVNGQQTQGENIADNGGMQAAYRAFKAYESFYGPDPRLPSLGATFNNDQLFFLSFAQTWCDAPDNDYTELLITTDTHSPNLDRVWGTLQNFPAFRTAFNCKVGSPYAPEKHCDVWTSAPNLPKPPTTP